MVHISVVVPAYNEELRIKKTLRRIAEFLKKRRYDYEIIVVDDGSTDGTARAVSSLPYPIKILRNDENRGKGYSVRRGLLYAKKDWILFSDADLSTPIEDVEKLLPHKGSDIIIGSRGLRESNIIRRQPFYRELAGKTFNLLVRLLTLSSIKDTQCGFKLFRRNVARDICRRQTIERFAFDVELLYIAKRRGYRIKEVPIDWTNDERTKVGFFTDSMVMLKDIIHIRINDLRGRYRS